MIELIVDDSLAEQIQQIAQQENRPLDAVLRAMLASYAATTAAPPHSDWPLDMARMAESDADIVWNAYATDLSERSREILDREFGDYLLKRLADNGDNSA